MDRQIMDPVNQSIISALEEIAPSQGGLTPDEFLKALKRMSEEGLLPQELLGELKRMTGNEQKAKKLLYKGKDGRDYENLESLRQANAQWASKNFVEKECRLIHDKTAKVFTSIG